MTTLPLTIVVAVAENGVIGRDNALPWRLRSDLRRFRTITWGKPLIMGRRNWDSIGRPLPGRETIVLTRQRGFSADGARVAHGWDEAKRAADDLAGHLGADEIIIAGGAEIYRLAFPEASRLRLTQVHARPEGDVVLPPYDRTAFEEVSREAHSAGPDDEYAFTYLDLARTHAG